MFKVPFSEDKNYVNWKVRMQTFLESIDIDFSNIGE
jgi:hypothetical protein